MRFPTTLSWVVTGAVLGVGCSQSGTPAGGPSPAGSDTVLVVDTVRIAAEASTDPATEARIARLELMLLERDARLREMQATLDATRQEVVRNLAKLQTQASRAEAASGLAEAEIALQTLGRMEGGMALSEYGQARARIVESSTEFGLENYGGALYLASEARALARSGQTRLSRNRDGALHAGETLFATEVPLRTGAQRANVRSGPGLSFEIVHTLEEDTPLTGQSYTSEWVRVVDDRGREGWIFHTLVTAPVR